MVLWGRPFRKVGERGGEGVLRLLEPGNYSFRIIGKYQRDKVFYGFAIFWSFTPAVPQPFQGLPDGLFGLIPGPLFSNEHGTGSPSLVVLEARQFIKGDFQLLGNIRGLGHQGL